MAQQTINLGTVANEGQDGDDARTAFTKVNQNFDEVYAGIGGAQPTNPKLTAIAASVWAANQLMYATGPNAVAMTPLTVAGRALLDDADAPAQRVTLGLGGQILQALQALTMTANGVPYMASTSTMAVQASTAFGRTLWNVADQAAAQVAVGGSTVGRALFTAASEAAARTTLQLGTGATLDVTASSTDTTANRLTKVGDFGLGTLSGIVATTAQMDGAALGGGTYRCDPASPWRGLPVSVYGVWTSPLNAVNSNAQIALNYLTGTLYARGRYQDNFKEHYNTGNAVGTVSQSGGAPSGAIVESGTTANGTFTKYLDGTMICEHVIATSAAIDLAYLGGFRSGQVTWAFPVAFAAPPVVLCNSLVNFAVSAMPGNVLQAQAGLFYYANQASAAASRSMSVMAKGRWF